jgi:uroporphyrinogen-III decarboxylase
MAEETMTAEERVWSAIRLEKPDRVPVNILATTAYATATGATAADWLTRSIGDERRWAMIDKVWDYTGGWDMDLSSIPSGDNPRVTQATLSMSMGVKMQLPGIDLPDDATAQAAEEEIMLPSDYEIVSEIGWERFMQDDLLYRMTGITREEFLELRKARGSVLFDALARWKKRGVVTLYPATGFPQHPFFNFSTCRSMVKFMEDLYYNPKPVEKALKRVTQEFIELIISRCKLFDTKLTFLAEERAEAFFFPLPMFERFWWPYTMEIVNALWSEGIVTWFHLDQNWDKNLPYFKQLPRGSAILALDSTTNIFAAKELLRGHLCLAGDVSPALMSIGTPEEVETYCRKLIDEVGDDGGFILGTGCEMPTAVKLDNWRAMVQTARNYELSRK